MKEKDYIARAQELISEGNLPAAREALTLANTALQEEAVATGADYEGVLGALADAEQAQSAAAALVDDGTALVIETDDETPDGSQPRGYRQAIDFAKANPHNLQAQLAGDKAITARLDKMGIGYQAQMRAVKQKTVDHKATLEKQDEFAGTTLTEARAAYRAAGSPASGPVADAFQAAQDAYWEVK